MSAVCAPRSLLALVIFLPLVAPGCVVPGRVRRVPMDLPDEEVAAILAAPRAPPADLASGAALDLRALQEEARRRNPVVAEWAARVDAFEASAAQVRSGYFPSVVSQARYAVRDEELEFRDPAGGSIVIEDRDQLTVVTSLRYSLIDWGRTHHLHQASLQELLGEAARRRRGLQELDFQVARAYYGLLSARQELETIDASVRTLEGALRLARSMNEVGRATTSDVLVVEARLERRRFAGRRTGDLIRDAEERLSFLLDLPPEVLVPLAEPEAPDTAALRSVAWQELALREREELRELEAARQALVETRRAELATFFPELGVFLQHEASTTESDFREEEFFSGGLEASWELFGGLRRSARMRELEARARSVSAQHRELVRAVRLEVRQASRALERARDAVAVSQVVIRQAEENLRRLTLLFEEGRATGQELLEAESLLTTERARAVLARFDVLLAIAQLRYVCGLERGDSLFEPLAPDPEARADRIDSSAGVPAQEGEPGPTDDDENR